MRDVNLLEYMGMDAQKWAEMFAKTFAGEIISPSGGNAAVDQGALIGWFAAAIESGKMSQQVVQIPHLVWKCHEIASSKGWDDGRNPMEVFMLFVTEVAEAAEEWRNGKGVTETYWSLAKPGSEQIMVECPRDVLDLATTARTSGWDDMSEEEVASLVYWGFLKPEGVPSELADIVIRVFHAAGEWGIDLEHEILTKMRYNETRSHKHGGKRA